MNEPYPYYKNTKLLDEQRRRRKRLLPKTDMRAEADSSTHGLRLPSPEQSNFKSRLAIGGSSNSSFHYRPATSHTRASGRSLSPLKNSSLSSLESNILRSSSTEQIPESLIPPTSLARANADAKFIWPLANLLSQPSYNSAPQGDTDVKSVMQWVHFMNSRIEQQAGRLLPEDALEDVRNVQYMAFHELVRQVMVSNFARGQALLEMWKLRSELEDLEKAQFENRIASLETAAQEAQFQERQTRHMSVRTMSTASKIQQGRHTLATARSRKRNSVFDASTLAKVEQHRFSERIQTHHQQPLGLRPQSSQSAASLLKTPGRSDDHQRKTGVLPIFERFFLDIEAELPRKQAQAGIYQSDSEEHSRATILYKDLCTALERVHELEQENERLRLSGCSQVTGTDMALSKT